MNILMCTDVTYEKKKITHKIKEHDDVISTLRKMERMKGNEDKPS